MNWDAIGAIGEIIGALAVFISLLYLAAQIRTQNAQARLAALHDMSRASREVTGHFAKAEISDIFVRGNADYDSLSDAESVRLIVLATNLFRAWEEAFVERREGHLSIEVWELLARDYTQVMGAPAFQRVRSLRRQNYDPGFREFVDNLNSHVYVVR